MFSWQHLRSLLRSRVLDTRKLVVEGAAPYDADVLSLDGVTWRRLLDFRQGSRPLVVVFGSCT